MVFFFNRSSVIQFIDLGDNKIADTDDKLYESLAHLPLQHSSLSGINLGDNSIKAGLVESLCNVNKSQVEYQVHGSCEKISLMYVNTHMRTPQIIFLTLCTFIGSKTVVCPPTSSTATSSK